MPFNIKLSNESRLDLREANNYYLGISKKLKDEFSLEISSAIDRITLNPENFQKRYRNIKIVFTKKFPFGIHYIIEANTVYIQRVLHEKRLYK